MKHNEILRIRKTSIYLGFHYESSGQKFESSSAIFLVTNQMVAGPPRDASRSTARLVTPGFRIWPNFLSKGPRYQTRINAVLKAYVQTHRKAS